MSGSNEVLTNEEFEKFREFFYRKTGISFDNSKRYFVDRRIFERMSATKHNDFRNYFLSLRFEAAGKEMEHLVNALTVNETYFYREEYQFRCMVSSILPEVAKTRTPGDRIRIWSLPCSTGEEPYSIALYLLENWSDVDRFDVEISGSDIDTRVIEQARRGVYGQRSVQNLSPDILKRYFIKQAGKEEFCLSDAIRQSIDFSHVNLYDRHQMKKHADMDIIFCRNLLIYFDDVSRRQAIESLYDALRPGGFICLGHSESMSRISSLFKIRKFQDAIVYQKPFD